MPTAEQAPARVGDACTPETRAATDHSDRAEIAAICGGYHAAPFDVLGPHAVEERGLVVRAFRPLDARVFVLDPATGTRTELTKVDPAGFFEARHPRHTRNRLPTG